MTKKDLLLLPAVLYAASASATGASPVSVSGCWVRALPDSGAAYFTVANSSDQPMTLTDVNVEDYGMAMLHESKKVGGMMKMSEVNEVTVPPHGNVAFAPGAYHVMLMDAKNSPQIGDSLRLTLKFKQGAEATASCVVKGPDGSPSK
jgi:copper(I)-binding protein